MRPFIFARQDRLTKTEKIVVTLILVTALAARLYYVFATPGLKLTHDEIGYHEMTFRFFEQGFMGYYSDVPSAFITPGYPVFLILVYSLAGLIKTDPLMTARVIQVFISVGSVFLVYMIARKAGGQRAALAAAFLAAIYPPSFMANKRILTEVPYTFLLLGYIYSVILAFERRDLKWHALSGGILAVTVLVRPAVAPFMAVPYLTWLVLKKDFSIIRGAIAAGIVFCLVMSPWWVRNYVVFDKFIMFATQSGDPLLRGTDPYDVYDKYGPSIIEGIRHEKKTEAAIECIKKGFREDPVLYFKWYTVGKFSFLWFKPWGMYDQWTKTLHFWVFVVIGWLGTIVNLFNERMRWPAMLVLFFSVLHLLFIPITRYIYPLTPIMAIMAATGAARIVQKAAKSS